MNKGNWKVSIHSCGKVMIENTKTGFCDWPIKYKDGHIAYDYPYSIPKYAKEMVYKFYNNTTFPKDETTCNLCDGTGRLNNNQMKIKRQ